MNSEKSFQFSFIKSSESDFESHALELFRYQAGHNAIYDQYLSQLGIIPKKINRLDQIPFMPIEFFKSFIIKTNVWQEEIVFESSGTTGMTPSRHYIKDVDAYKTHAKNLFEDVFGSVNDLTILALLPSYLERQGSSLVSMVDYLINASANANSGFFLHQYDELLTSLEASRGEGEVILFGVSFALLELAERYKLDLSHVTLIETGGMKGRRAELTHKELYDILQEQLNFKSIYSEYGMTELLSQAYGLEGNFECPESMHVMIRDINDPFSYVWNGRTGGINVVDLANFDTCAFIETKDIGRIATDGTFEVLGRFDNSELRGCNLLVG